jgi:hypothetical protein
METQPNYLAVLRLATAKLNRDDRPGQLVSIQRRARAGETRRCRPKGRRVLGRAKSGRAARYHHREVWGGREFSFSISLKR